MHRRPRRRRSDYANKVQCVRCSRRLPREGFRKYRLKKGHKNAVCIACAETKGGVCEEKSPTRDKEITLAAVQRNPMALARASEACQDDREIVLTAVRQDPCALQHASWRWQNDRDLVLTALRQTDLHNFLPGKTGWHAPEMRTAITLSQVEHNGLLLRHASADHQDNHDIVIKAVRQNGLALQYASARCRSHQEIVLAAVQETGKALRYACEDCQDNRAIVLAAVRWNGNSLRHASLERRNDKEIVASAVRNDLYSLQYASASLRADTDIYRVAETHCWRQRSDEWGGRYMVYEPGHLSMVLASETSVDARSQEA